MATLPWTDNPATSSTHIRARHINELRRTVDRNRRAANLSPFPWSDNPVSITTHIRATHFNEIRAAIPSSVTIGNWSVGHPPASTRQISARDINDLRGWVDQFSQSLRFPTGPDPVPQGVTSFTIDENSPSYVMIDQTWVNDLLLLGPGLQLGGPLNVRADIRATASTNVVATGAYASAFQLYRSNGILSTGLLTRQFDVPGSPNNPHSENDAIIAMSNPYIDHFVGTATSVINQLVNNGVGGYIIWNEPNAANPPTPGALAAQNFAALLYQCYTHLRPLSGVFNMYMGGILWPFGQPSGGGSISAPQASDMVHDYLQAVYNFLLDNRVGRYYGTTTPWDAVNVHVHHCTWQDSDMDYLYARINAVFDPSQNPHIGRDDVPDARPEDKKLIIVGEWGVTHDEQRNFPNCMANAFGSLNKRFDAMWYFQHPIHNPNATPGTCEDQGDVFGLIEWSESNVFVKGNACPEWTTLQSLYANP